MKRSKIIWTKLDQLVHGHWKEGENKTKKHTKERRETEENKREKGDTETEGDRQTNRDREIHDKTRTQETRTLKGR